MTSFNKYPQNLLSLYALEKQTFPLSKMEVVLVDDASTDQTHVLEEENFSFSFQYIRVEKNIGRAKAKNKSIFASKGRIIIMLDAEVIVDPDFVDRHYHHHKTENRLFVTGCTNHYGVYTVIHKSIKGGELNRFVRLAKKNIRQLSKETRVILENSIFRRKHFNYENKTRIFSKQDIQHMKYKLLAFPTPIQPKILSMFGDNLESFHLPWVLAVTRNVSFQRDLFDLTGPFSEQFQGWGCEDWEFGYRVHTCGGKIINDPNIYSYHQEHEKPIHYLDEDNANYLTFYTLHPEFEIGVMALRYCTFAPFDFSSVNLLVSQFKELEQVHQYKFQHFKSYYLQLFRKILELSVEKKKLYNLKNAVTLADSDFHLVISEKEEIKSLRKYNHLIQTFEILLNL